jgi:enoyl-CoA hydratase/carnithine racemase
VPPAVGAPGCRGQRAAADILAALPEVESHAGRLLVDEPAPEVARLTISNPGKRGALDHAILDSFATMLPSLDARCLIITGEDSTFSAGYDIGDLRSEVFAEEAEKLVAHPFAAALDAVEAYPYPTVAALNGHAIGGGLELALACDLRIAAGTVAVGMPPAKLGLVYSHTGIRKFIDTIGAPRTRELFLVGRRIDARTAREWGLVNALAEPGKLAEEALALAVEIASAAPLAQLGNKRVIRAVLDSQAELDPRVERELIELRRACFSSEDFREGVLAFAEKRKPQWKGR